VEPTIVGEGNDVFGDTCCDPSLSFDEYGNLFMTYLYNTVNTVPVALSTDGGLTFKVIANIAAPPNAPAKKSPGEIAACSAMWTSQQLPPQR